jgi:hypothetical protein
MIRKIIKNDKLYAIIVPANFSSDSKYNFMSPNESCLQFGINYYEAGDSVPKHIHLDCKREITRIEEIVVLRKGELILSIYDEHQGLVAEVRMTSGDIAYQMQGGHGFKFLEKSEIFEVKQGPYLSKEMDKRLF